MAYVSTSASGTSARIDLLVPCQRIHSGDVTAAGGEVGRDVAEFLGWEPRPRS